MGDPTKSPDLPPASAGQTPGGGDRETWLKLAVVVLSIVLAGVLVGGIVVLASGGNEKAAAPSTVTISTKIESAPVRTVEKTTVLTRATSQPAQQSASIDEWPGGAGYTAILASVRSRSEAESFTARAAASGLEAGILWSSNHSSLRPGWWAVFSGKFANQPQAADRAMVARGNGFDGAYSRFVSN